MTKVIIDVIYGFFSYYIQVVLNPILTGFDAVFGLIPGYDSLVEIMWSTFNTYIFPFTYWFASFIPARALEVILLELLLYIFYFNLAIPIWLIAKVFNVAKKLPFA